MRLFIVCFVIILLACPYQDTLEETENTELLTGQNLTNWNTEYGISVENSVELGPGNKAAWEISMGNLIENDDFETINSGSIMSDLSGWTEDFSAGYNSSANTIKQSSTDNYMLHLKIGDKADNIYQLVSIDKSLITDSYVNLFFRFKYENLTSIGIQVSYGTAGTDMAWLGKDISESNGFSSSGYYLWPFTVRLDNTTGSIFTFNIRLGSKNTDENGREFESYFDNIALFYQNSSTLYKVFTSSNNFVKIGSYEFSVYAKLSENNESSSRQASLNLFAKPKNITVTDSWQRYTIKARYSSGDFRLAISPTVYNANERYPGSILISSPSLIFFPDKNFN